MFLDIPFHRRTFKRAFCPIIGRSVNSWAPSPGPYRPCRDVSRSCVSPTTPCRTNVWPATYQAPIPAPADLVFFSGALAGPTNPSPSSTGSASGFNLMPTWGQSSRFHILLVGPWLGIESQIDGVLGEGGIEFTIAPTHADDMMYGLRLGGGGGTDASGRAALLSATLLMGFRNVPESCDLLTLARGVRVYATVRDAFPNNGVTAVASFEVEPSLLFPPYSRRGIVGLGGNGGCTIGE